jgi:hypothetical protein
MMSSIGMKSSNGISLPPSPMQIRDYPPFTGMVRVVLIVIAGAAGNHPALVVHWPLPHDLPALQSLRL